MSISRSYQLHNMAVFPGSLGAWDGVHGYVWSGTIPAWFIRYPIGANPNPTFGDYLIMPPQGVSGSWLFGVQKVNLLTSAVVDTGLFGIYVQATDFQVWKRKWCYTANLVWLNPQGGFQSYLFASNQQVFQDGGNAETFINSAGETRYHRREEVHQGVLISTSPVPDDHAAFIQSLFKSAQSFLWGQGLAASGQPIIIRPETFRRVKTSEPWDEFAFEFRMARADTIQTQ
jgi:hypothetical protein